jgi:hypothetical protein
MLRLVPQLAVLAVLDEALSTSVCVLLAQHPELAPTPDESSITEPSDARRLYDCLVHTSHVLADYRLAIAAMIADLDTASIPPPADFDL